MPFGEIQQKFILSSSLGFIHFNEMQLDEVPHTPTSVQIMYVSNYYIMKKLF